MNMAGLKLKLTKTCDVVTCYPMRGWGLIFSLIILFNVVVSSFEDNCVEAQADNTSSFATCSSEMPHNSSSDNSGEHHCFFHCTHNSASFVFSILEFHPQPLVQELSFTNTHLISSPYINSLFRPPIA